MKAQIIKIGNSHGIRIPKSVLEETRISGEVELDVTPEGILIRKTKKIRGDWESIFKSLSDTDDDLNLADTRTDFAKKEWQW
jgi:antitoxin MazE